MVFPKPLTTGDKVAILSPASYIDPARVDGAAKVLGEWGFDPVVCPHCKGVNGSYSGTVEERLSDLLWALAEPSVRAILCSRGGYGTIHLLQHVAPSTLRRDPKWIIGFSDISALHAMSISSGIASIHASMAKHLAEHGSKDACNQLLLNALQGVLPCYKFPFHPLNRDGEASGTVVGGNLAVLCGLVSTPYDILKPGRILFIEDIAEEIYRVERMLYTLRLNGTLANLRGLIVGQFTDYRNHERNGETMEHMIRRMAEPFDYPVAMGCPIGHINGNIPMIEGARATLSVAHGTAMLKFI